jgi:hypothetical protein
MLIIKRNTNNTKRFICDYMNCDFECTHRATIERHIIQKHMSRKTINCLFDCDQEFWTRKELLIHVRETHNEVYDKNSQMFKCTYNECKHQFDGFSKLLMHRKRHFEEKSIKCSDKYPFCRMKFFTVAEMKAHQKLVHRPQKLFVCDWNQCGQQFERRKQLGFDFIHLFIFLFSSIR